MATRVAVFGASFNPPGAHHREIACVLSKHFDQVIIVPCGPRPDKPVTNDVPTVYRAAMTDMTFAGVPKVSVDLFDLEASTFTRTHRLQERYQDRGEVWHVISTDLIAGAADGNSFIQQQWEAGERVFNELRFAVIRRPGFPLDVEDLPPRHELFDCPVAGESKLIRGRVFEHQPIDGQVVERVEWYIARHNLYRGIPPQPRRTIQIDSVRPVVVVDERNPQAVQMAKELGSVDEADANVVVVLGGDGTMLRAIRAHWRKRLPFYGINTGHIGFLLNKSHINDCLSRRLKSEHLPLLWVQAEGPDGPMPAELAFNDAWVERATGQTAWLRVSVDGTVRIQTLMADGALISTAAGSTSYARAMGASPIPLSSQALILVGSNVLRPPFLRPAVLPIDSEVELRTIEPERRPLRGYIDGIDQGSITSLTARVSNIASVELVFDPGHAMADKLAEIQFP